MGILIGAIADDYTGATDLGSILTEQGLRVIQYNGVPEQELRTDGYDVVIIALKSRSIPAEQAINQSLEALTYLQKSAAKQFYFKYCSTFDSTAKGNIGPVTKALMKALDVNITIACPAFPINGRSVYNGYLYVGEKLLSDSHMRHHPLNPMTDANLVSFLRSQTDLDIDLVNYQIVKEGREVITNALINDKSQSKIVVIDAIEDNHLVEIGHACKDMKLLTGASGLGIGMAAAITDKVDKKNQIWKSSQGSSAVLSGSCSNATLGQVNLVKDRWPSYKINTNRLGDNLEVEISNWIDEHIASAQPLLIYSSEEQGDRTNKGEDVSLAIESLMTKLGVLLVKKGVTNLIVAGGETSGAVLNGLEIKSLEIGPTIAPGVPWTNVKDEGISMSVALKSGNFGAETFFEDAFNILGEYE